MMTTNCWKSENSSLVKQFYSSCHRTAISCNCQLIKNNKVLINIDIVLAYDKTKLFIKSVCCLFKSNLNHCYT